MNNPRFSSLTGWTTAAITLLTFVIAIFTPPISGPFCQSDCIGYPYLAITDRFPRDYWWMFPAMLMSLLYIMMLISLHGYAKPEKKLFLFTAVSFAVISSIILIINYFVQVTVIQPSLLNGETDGIALITQYNPHGVFIALEEAGYLMMSLSFLAVFPVFSNQSRIELALRRTFLAGFLFTTIALIWISLVHGIHREYYFEVTVISIDFLVLIITGILSGILFGKK